MTSVKDLKPCPFCGSKAELCIGEHAMIDAKVRCTNSECGTEGGCWDRDTGDPDFWERDNIVDAIAAWNRRTE